MSNIKFQIKNTNKQKETSDEEKAAYMDRRNGVGARLVPALAQVSYDLIDFILFHQ
jgi:hypothetical protein